MLSASVLLFAAAVLLYCAGACVYSMTPALLAGVAALWALWFQQRDQARREG